ncbi:hypothetical protein [Amazonocrinis nigriterrae]|nr:hypothetical protein [Amazonocrinis nigriterrae]
MQALVLDRYFTSTVALASLPKTSTRRTAIAHAKTEQATNSANT